MSDISNSTFRDDPSVPDWPGMSLPDTWPDQLRFTNPVDLFHFFQGILSKRRYPTELADDVPGRALIPKYVLQEFHSLPNGNYSNRITRQYIVGFDRAMLGKMRLARAKIAEQLSGLNSILDVGCGGGAAAAACAVAGAKDVWGLDPSPYLLQYAASAHGHINFVQGVAEDIPFADQRFDGIAVCFLFHEMPPRYIEEALAEIDRVLKPGGLISICEPSPTQMKESLWHLAKRYGFYGLYFRTLASLAFEPFVASWHSRNIEESFKAYGFELISDEDQLPVRHILARKP